MAIQIGSNDLNSDGIPGISTLLSYCQGLAIIEKGTSTVRLIHYTLREYLCTLPDLFDRAHSIIAAACLTYLNFRWAKDISAGSSPGLRGIPLLEYSSLYWGTHMRIELSDRSKTFALQLLDQFDGHISAKLLWESIKGKFFRCEFFSGHAPDEKGFSALHCISYFGIADIANTLIKMKRWELNQKDGAGMAPLIWAAGCGHEEMVRLLLRKKHIQPDLLDTNCGRTALSWASGNGHEGVMRLLLEPRQVNPGSASHGWAKVQRVVGLLLGKRCVNPNSYSKLEETPLLWAIKNGHEGIVKLLHGQKDVNFSAPETTHGRTLLSVATRNGHEGIVKLLVGRKDVNPNPP